MSRNISASGQLTWNTPVDGLSFIGKVGMNYWTKYDKATGLILILMIVRQWDPLL